MEDKLETYIKQLIRYSGNLPDMIKILGLVRDKEKITSVKE